MSLELSYLLRTDGQMEKHMQGLPIIFLFQILQKLNREKIQFYKKLRSVPVKLDKNKLLSLCSNYNIAYLNHFTSTTLIGLFCLGNFFF